MSKQDYRAIAAILADARDWTGGDANVQPTIDHITRKLADLMAAGRSSGAWKAEADALRSRPGQWARIAEYPSDHSAYMLAHRVRHGKAKAFGPAGHFEARATRGIVWARHTGGNHYQEES